MNEYTVRSTRTRADSMARRAADVIVVLLICAGILTLLFKFALVPERVDSSGVSGIEEGDILLIDRFSKFLSDYKLGDVVAAEPGAGRGRYRIAALGGSTYLVTHGKAYLDDLLIDESAYSEGWPEDAELYIEVPEDSVLLLPDDRGGVTELSDHVLLYNDIFGEVRLRIYPWGRIALFY